MIDGAIALIDDPLLPPEGLLDYIQGPDFPTGGLILGRSGIRQALLTGRGSIMVRARVAIETIRKEREALIITEIPIR